MLAVGLRKKLTKMRKLVGSNSFRNLFVRTINIMGVGLLITLLLTHCKDDSPTRLTPKITLLTPAVGTVGTLVSIKGENFSQAISENIVTFNGTSSIVTEASPTELMTMVPAGATTGPIEVNVLGSTASSPAEFTVVPLPGISGFAPTAGVAGVTVIISGNNFDSQPSKNVVRFNGTIAIVSAATPSELVTTIPVGATSGKITVSSHGVTITSVSDFSVFPPPSIGGFTPSNGIAGASITINGTNFSSTASENIVSFNGTEASVISASNNQLVVTVPTGAVSGKISVRTHGVTITSASNFTVLFPPVVTSFSPTYGLPGVNVTIEGLNFDLLTGNNAVTFNNVSATVVSSTSDQLTVTVPALATTGKISITVNSLSVESSTNFEVLKDIPRNNLLAFFPFTGNGVSQNTTSFNFPLGSPSQPALPTLASDRFGKLNQALNFNGSQSTSLVLQTILPNRPWTICVWLNPGAFNDTVLGFMNASSSSLSGISFRFENLSSGDFYIQVTGDDGPSPGGNYSFVNSVPLTRYIPGSGTNNTWFLISMTYDGSTFRVLKNNSEVYSTSYSTQTTPDNAFNLGQSTDITQKYVGGMDDLIVYDRILTPAELTQVFEQTISKYQ